MTMLDRWQRPFSRGSGRTASTALGPAERRRPIDGRGARSQAATGRRARRAERTLAARAGRCRNGAATARRPSFRPTRCEDGQACSRRSAPRPRHLLEGLAHDFHVEAWLSDLEIPAWNLYRLLGLPQVVKACVFDLEDVLAASPRCRLLRGGRPGPPSRPDAAPARRPLRASSIHGSTTRHLHARPRLAGVKEFLASRGIKLPDGDPGDPPGCETVHGLRT